MSCPHLPVSSSGTAVPNSGPLFCGEPSLQFLLVLALPVHEPELNIPAAILFVPKDCHRLLFSFLFSGSVKFFVKELSVDSARNGNATCLFQFFIHATKNRHSKTFVITDNLTDLLQKLCNEHAQNEEMFGCAYVQDWNGYLMRYKDGQLISPNALTRAFSQFIEKHGLKKVRYHDLRHSCASILYANGTDIMTIQEILGHAQLTTTLMYTHKLSDRKTLALAQIDAQFLGVDKEKNEK